MGWFWADTDNTTSKTSQAPPAKCPVDHKALQKSAASAPAVCPVKPKGSSTNITTTTPDLPAVCPMKKSKNADSFNPEEVNHPLNNMPHIISEAKMPGQKLDLPTQRTFSSIPRGTSESEGVWEYPSPQQMFNAMVRKGKGEDIPEDAVESMVDVHNFLNEGAWQEILEWEKPHIEESGRMPRLEQFTGRPHDLSPRAMMYLQLSKFFPGSYNSEPPFDRHDWYVLRANKSTGNWDSVRYVIDYYGGPDDEAGMPTFFLDVRPALDGPSGAKDRFVHWAKPMWDKAMGNSISSLESAVENAKE